MDLCAYVWVCVSVCMIRVDCIYDDGTMKNTHIHTYIQTNITPSFQTSRESNEPTKRIILFLYTNRQRVSVNCLPITLWTNENGRSYIKLCCFRRVHSIHFLNSAEIYFNGTEDFFCKWNALSRYWYWKYPFHSGGRNVKKQLLECSLETILDEKVCLLFLSFCFSHIPHTVFRAVI